MISFETEKLHVIHIFTNHYKVFIKTIEVKYILDLMMKEKITSKTLRKKEEISYVLSFPEKLCDHAFYEKQLKKVFIYFISHNPAISNFPNESESNLFPREIDKVILNGEEPPSEVYCYDQFFMEYEDEKNWMTHEIKR